MSSGRFRTITRLLQDVLPANLLRDGLSARTVSLNAPPQHLERVHDEEAAYIGRSNLVSQTFQDYLDAERAHRERAEQARAVRERIIDRLADDLSLDPSAALGVTQENIMEQTTGELVVRRLRAGALLTPTNFQHYLATEQREVDLQIAIDAQDSGAGQTLEERYFQAQDRSNRHTEYGLPVGLIQRRPFARHHLTDEAFERYRNTMESPAVLNAYLGVPTNRRRPDEYIVGWTGNTAPTHIRHAPVRFFPNLPENLPRSEDTRRAIAARYLTNSGYHLYRSGPQSQQSLANCLVRYRAVPREYLEGWDLPPTGMSPEPFVHHADWVAAQIQAQNTGYRQERIDEITEAVRADLDSEPILETPIESEYPMMTPGTVTIPMLKKNFHEHFGRLGYSDEAEIRFGIDFLEKMVTQTSLRLETFDVTPFMEKKGESNDFIRSKQLINKKLFELRNEAGRDDESEKRIAEQKALLDRFMQRAGRTGINERTVRDNRDLIRQYTRAIEESALKITTELNKDSKDGGKYHSDMWDLDTNETGTSYFTWVTKNEIVLHEVNPALGIDRKWNCGKIRVKYRYTDRDALFLGCNATYPVNRIFDGYYHPHISGSSICLGTATVPIADALAKNDIGKALDLLYIVLNQYNKESPYYPLDRFCELRDRNLADKGYTPEESKELGLRVEWHVAPTKGPAQPRPPSVIDSEEEPDDDYFGNDDEAEEDEET